MNYYELKDFKSIDINELIIAFKNGNTITNGCISVFEDSIGKPGDRLVELNKISVENSRIIFEFGNNEKIVVKNPSHIVINDNVIGIQSCEKVKWLTTELRLKYTLEDNEINTEVIEGNHFFRVKKNASALLFYTW